MALSPGAASATVGGSPAASDVPFTAPEVIEDNPHGEHSGGFASALPTDSATLRTALERARASGAPPHAYGTVTRQYWLAVGAENAGIDLEQWDPERGRTAHLDPVDQGEGNYQPAADSRRD